MRCEINDECQAESRVSGLFFLNDTATTEIYTSLFVGSVRCIRDRVARLPDEGEVGAVRVVNALAGALCNIDSASVYAAWYVVTP